MNTTTYPMDNDAFRAATFLKMVKVKVKDGILEFLRGKKNYRLKSDCLKNLEGKTVLVASSMEIQRGDKIIGHAEPA